jgi:hypothetical protein
MSHHLIPSHPHILHTYNMSSANITCLAPIHNPRQLSNKVVLLDAELYVSPGETVSTLLRYFNVDDIDFSDTHLYMVRFAVSPVHC